MYHPLDSSWCVDHYKKTWFVECSFKMMGHGVADLFAQLLFVIHEHSKATLSRPLMAWLFTSRNRGLALPPSQNTGVPRKKCVWQMKLRHLFSEGLFLVLFPQSPASASWDWRVLRHGSHLVQPVAPDLPARQGASQAPQSMLLQRMASPAPFANVHRLIDTHQTLSRRIE